MGWCQCPFKTTHALNHIVFERGRLVKHGELNVGIHLSWIPPTKPICCPTKIYRKCPGCILYSSANLRSLAEYAAENRLPVLEKHKVISVENLREIVFSITVSENGTEKISQQAGGSRQVARMKRRSRISHKIFLPEFFNTLRANTAKQQQLPEGAALVVEVLSQELKCRRSYPGR